MQCHCLSLSWFLFPRTGNIIYPPYVFTCDSNFHRGVCQSGWNSLTQCFASPCFLEEKQLLLPTRPYLLTEEFVGLPRLAVEISARPILSTLTPHLHLGDPSLCIYTTTTAVSISRDRSTCGATPTGGKCLCNGCRTSLLTKYTSTPSPRLNAPRCITASTATVCVSCANNMCRDAVPCSLLPRKMYGFRVGASTLRPPFAHTPEGCL